MPGAARPGDPRPRAMAAAALLLFFLALPASAGDAEPQCWSPRCRAPGCILCDPAAWRSQRCQRCGVGYELLSDGLCGCAPGYGSWLADESVPARYRQRPPTCPSGGLYSSRSEVAALSARVEAEAAATAVAADAVTAAGAWRSKGRLCACFRCPAGWSSPGGPISSTPCTRHQPSPPRSPPPTARSPPPRLASPPPRLPSPPPRPRSPPPPQPRPPPLAQSPPPPKPPSPPPPSPPPPSPPPPPPPAPLQQLALAYNPNAYVQGVYTLQLGVGTPAQVVSPVFDTTSALTQLPRVGCESPGYPSCAANSSWTGSTVPTLFAPNASSTYQLLATNATINYTDVLSTTNDIGQDAVAAVTSTQATLPSALLQLALVAQESYGSLASVFEGISGWGRAPAGANTSALPYYAAAAAQLQLPPVFGLWLNPATSSFYALNASQAPVPGGYVTLGGYARSMFADNAPPSWVPLASAPCSTNSLLAGSNLWCVQVQGVAAAGYSAACSTGAPCSAAVDSTNPSIVADPATMAALLSAMGLSNLASMSRADAAPVIYCSNIPTLPSLTLTLNGSSYELPAAAYTRNMSGICTLQLNSSAALSPGQLVLGQPWLRWYATVFDASVGRIGFGPAAGRPAPVPPPASLASVTFRGRYTPDSGDKYTMDVVIGTPAQTITNVVVDSGSQALGLNLYDCSTQTSCYYANQSTSAVLLSDKVVSQTYGGADNNYTTYAYIYSDEVTFGSGLPVFDFQRVNDRFNTTQTYTTGPSIQGIMGFGTFDGYGNSNGPFMPGYQQLFNLYLFPQPWFSLWLNPATARNATTVDASRPVPGAYVTIGGPLPAALFSGAISWTPAVTGQGNCGSAWWCVGLQGVQVSGDPGVFQGMCDGSGGCYALVDSGTQTLSSSEYNAVQLCTALNAQAGAGAANASANCPGLDSSNQTAWLLPPETCQSNSSVPAISITLGGGGTFDLPPAAYSRLISGSCTLLIRGGSSSNASWTLGDTFLRWWTATFDATNPSGLRVGFAQAVPGVDLPVP